MFLMLSTSVSVSMLNPIGMVILRDITAEQALLLDGSTAEFSRTASPAGAWRHLSLQLVAKPQQVQTRQSLAHGKRPFCTLLSPTQGFGSANSDGSCTIQHD